MAEAPFRVYLWDTFEMPGEDTTLLTEVPTLAEALRYIADHHGDRLRPKRGADRIEIVYQGDVLVSLDLG